MTGADFIKAIRELGRRRGVAVAVDTKRGKGSHVALYFGERRTIVQDRKKDIPRPTLKSMLRDLGLTERELP